MPCTNHGRRWVAIPVSKQLQGMAQTKMLVLLCKHSELPVAGEQAGLRQFWICLRQHGVQVGHVLLHVKHLWRMSLVCTRIRRGAWNIFQREQVPHE